MYNKMSIKFFDLIFIDVDTAINFDIWWSVIAKCIKSPLMGTHSACGNVLTEQLIELLLIFSGDVKQNPGTNKENLI